MECVHKYGTELVLGLESRVFPLTVWEFDSENSPITDVSIPQIPNMETQWLLFYRCLQAQPLPQTQ